MKKTFFLKLFPVIALIAIIPLCTFAFFSSVISKDNAIKISRYELTETARIAASAVRTNIEEGGDTNRLLKSLAKGSSLRLTVIDRLGTVLYDSSLNPIELENHGAREEVRDSFELGSGSSSRRSVSTGIETIYAGVRLDISSRVASPLVLRAALPLPFITSEMYNRNVFLACVLLVLVMVSLLISFYAANRLRLPIMALERTAERWSSGDLMARATVHEPLEMARLGEIMNTMISELETRISSTEKSEEEIRAVFDAMTEAVIVTDASGIVVSKNPVADTFFALDAKDPQKAPGTILEYTRNSAITALDALSRSGSTSEIEITLYGHSIRHLSVVASPLPISGGAVIVASDITHLLHLETIRKDFVSNVSHELKTPIQSIRGFAETLSSGALEDPESAAQFVAIIARQAERMEDIIEDLLSLARMERNEESLSIENEAVAVQDILSSVLETATSAANEKNIRFVIEKNESAIVRGSKGLLEQAVFNLVDNAIKFSSSGSDVFLSVSNTGTVAEISVRDCGSGIPPSDIERVFERFFRVDKSRSRESGGTGLGLAIVKHIALVHKGSVTVKSDYGKGSLFTFSIPLAPM